MSRRTLALVAIVVLLGTLGASGLAGAHYTPQPKDGFAYDETVALSDGVGNYTGYTESTRVNGSIAVTSVLGNGTESANYYYADDYSNDQGASQNWTSTGSFTFSAVTFRYVSGTDNQTGYTNPYVWFYMDNDLVPGQTFYLLNSEFTVVSTAYNFDLGTAAGGYVRTIYAEGNGSYQRDDAYGVFTATYNWKVYFDPSTGYVVGYVYTEQDMNQSVGAGFTWTDSLSVTQTSYPLTAGSAPSGTSSSSGAFPWVTLAILLVVVVVVVVVLVALLARARRSRPLPKHSPTGQVSYAPPPMGPPPPGIHLNPSGQPAVQQIVIKETVKVNCKYCGALIDSTVENCPFCGAPRN